MIPKSPIFLNDSAPPASLPQGYVGPVVLPGTNRAIWWTGRVAIGLRYDRERSRSAEDDAALWVQSAMLRAQPAP